MIFISTFIFFKFINSKTRNKICIHNLFNKINKRAKRLKGKVTDAINGVRYGFPGQTPKEKMSKVNFELEKGIAEGDDKPLVLKDAYQVFECTWDDQLENAFEDKV